MLVRLKDVAAINAHALSDSTPSDFSFRYIDIGAVTQGKISMPVEEMTFGSAPSRARRLAESGDTVVSTVRTYLRAVAAVPETDEPLVFSTGFAVLHPRNIVDGRYLSYYCQSAPFVDEIVARSVGVSYPAINPGDIGNFRLELPSLEEQRRIADFLDAETARIDRLIGIRQRQAALLEQRPWILLGNLVTNDEVNWLPLRRALTFLSDGPFGSAFSSGDYVDEGAAVVRLGNIGFANYRGDAQAFIPAAAWATFPRSHVRPGDLLIAGLGDANNHAGRACVAPDLGQALVKGKCFVARVDEQVASAPYLALLLSSSIGRDVISVETQGSTRAMINLEIVKSAVLPLPPRSVQDRVVETVERSSAQGLALRSSVLRQVALLSQRRQAVVAAAVSGQLDVTAAQGVA